MHTCVLEAPVIPCTKKLRCTSLYHSLYTTSIILNIKVCLQVPKQIEFLSNPSNSFFAMPEQTNIQKKSVRIRLDFNTTSMRFNNHNNNHLFQTILLPIY